MVSEFIGESFANEALEYYIGAFNAVYFDKAV
jgi:hypothetical protein